MLTKIAQYIDKIAAGISPFAQEAYDAAILLRNKKKEAIRRLAELDNLPRQEFQHVPHQERIKRISDVVHTTVGHKYTIQKLRDMQAIEHDLKAILHE